MDAQLELPLQHGALHKYIRGGYGVSEMANQNPNDKASIQQLIPVWLRNRKGLACGVLGLYILFYIAWTKFHWGATEAFRLIPSWGVDRNFALISDLAYQPVSLFATIVAWRIARNPAFETKLR